MIQGIEGILLGSSNAQTLAHFYRDVVGLTVTSEAEMGEENQNLYVFGFKGCALYIIDHSEVKGKNKQPGRLIFNLEVDDIEKEVARLKKRGVKLVQDTYHVEGYGLIATFADPDGNYFQLVKTRP